MSAFSLLQSLFEYKAWANRELFVELEKLDTTTHAAERHSAIRLLNHIYVVDRIFAAHLAGETHTYTGTNTPETPAFEDLRAAVAASDQWYLDYLGKLGPDALEEPVRFTFTDGAKGCMSREEMLAHVITHGGYHRGAVGRIMAQVSVPPPRDIFTVFLQGAEPGRRLA